MGFQKSVNRIDLQEFRPGIIAHPMQFRKAFQEIDIA